MSRVICYEQLTSPLVVHLLELVSGLLKAFKYIELQQSTTKILEKGQ